MRAIAIQNLVRRLLTHEAAESQNQEALIEAAERVSDRLRTHLSKLIGQEGFRTLLARSLTLTTVRFPYFSAVQIAVDGSLIGLRGATGRVQTTPDNKAPEDTVEGAVALLAYLITLLITFIGEDLTARIVSSVWPQISWGDAESEKL